MAGRLPVAGLLCCGVVGGGIGAAGGQDTGAQAAHGLRLVVDLHGGLAGGSRRTFSEVS